MLLANLSSALLGAMIMFNLVVTPVVFTQLGEEASGRFLRAVFPRLFSFGLVLSVILFGSGLWLSATLVAGIAGLIALGFALNIWVITPAVNRARDAMLSGVSGNQTFHFLHLLSVAVFIAQAIGLVVILWLV